MNSLFPHFNNTCSIQLFIILLFFILTIVNAGHVYTDSFPTNDEYDYAMLDPESIYGAPYSGYSRATRSRLASVPLYLPDVLSDDDDERMLTGSFGFDDDDQTYMDIRDAAGRLFICRIYNEDELDPSSHGDSMYTAPKLRQLETSLATTTPAAPTTSGDTSHRLIENGNKNAIAKASSSDKGSTSSGDDATKAVTTIDDGETNTIDIIHNKRLAIQTKLNELQDICGQLHKGWWSYEICIGRTISQFHVSVDQTSGMYKVEYITSLGQFVGRTILVDLENEPPNDFAEELPELARVIDLYDNGEMCGANNRPRRSYVHYQCCSRRVLMTGQGVITKDGIKMTTDIANVLDVIEAKTCEYNSTICTPLLCGDDEDFESADGTTSSSHGQRRKKELEKFKPKENETIQEILERSLGDECVIKVVDWWTYQFCNKAKIRQYHEESSNSDPTDHVLGKYKESVSESPSRVWGDEWSIVVNSTSDDSSAHSFIQGTENTGSTKTYYEVSYIDGDVCDGHDVKDSAIVAGSVTAGAAGSSSGDGNGDNIVLKRSTSVRYYCGPTLDFTINEDSTCHYVLQATVPQLCAHPLFREPIRKKQIMKCLPAASSE